MAALHEIVADLLASGADPQVIVATVRGFEVALNAGTVDASAERRRAADRERKAKKRSGRLRNSAESADIPEVPQTPAEPHAHVVIPSSSLRSEGEEPSLRSGTAVAVLDARDRLWGEGREILSTIAHKPDPAARSLIGKFLKSAGNDAERVLGAIIAARDHRVIDPVPWITQHLAKPSSSTPNDVRSYSERRFDQAFGNVEQRLRDIGCA